MTPKQTQRLSKKIADIKRALAAEKRRFGGYDDSRGLRYLPTRYYIQLADYKGGLSYTRWFAKLSYTCKTIFVFVLQNVVLIIIPLIKQGV